MTTPLVTRTLAVAGLVAPVWFTAMVVIQGALHPGYSLSSKHQGHGLRPRQRPAGSRVEDYHVLVVQTQIHALAGPIRNGLRRLDAEKVVAQHHRHDAVFPERLDGINLDTGTAPRLDGNLGRTHAENNLVDIDAFPDFSVEAAEPTGVVGWLGHQDDRVITYVDQEAVSGLDLEPPASFVRYGHEKAVRDLHTHGHWGPPSFMLIRAGAWHRR